MKFCVQVQVGHDVKNFIIFARVLRHKNMTNSSPRKTKQS